MKIAQNILERIVMISKVNILMVVEAILQEYVRLVIEGKAQNKVGQVVKIVTLSIVTMEMTKMVSYAFASLVLVTMKMLQLKMYAMNVPKVFTHRVAQQNA